MKNCLVFGAGRSGTSLFMSLLRNSNYYMGTNLYGPTDSNPTGYFESYRINRINEEIIGSNIPRRFFRFEDTFFSLPHIGEHLATINYHKHRPIINQRWLAHVPIHKKLICDEKVDDKILEQISNSPFCFKDPRFSVTLPYWKKFIDADKTLFIVLFRHPRSTIRSIQKECARANYLKNKIKLSLDYLDQLWINQYEHILSNYREDENWLFIHYEQIMSGDGLENISKMTGVSINEDLVNSNFYRNKETDYGSERQKEIYNYLCEKSGFSS